MAARIAKILMALSLATYAFLVTFSNLTDYGSNFAFVRHVLSMDTTFEGNRAMYRAITSPALWHAAYALIIAGEALTCGLFLVAGFALWRARHREAAAFDRAKAWFHAAAAAGFAVWFLGFTVIGGEWFLMWQSPDWNGQAAAFRITATILAVLIFVNQPDQEVT